MIAFAIKSNKNSDSPYEKVSLWEKGWILETPDGKNKSVTIPTEKVDTAEFKIKTVLPHNLASDDYLFVWVNNQEITVTVNGSRIYSYTPQYEKYINTDLAAEQYLIIPVSSSYLGKDIEISYINGKFSKGRAGNIYLGDKASVISHLLRQNLLTLLAGFIVFIFGLLAMVRYFGNRQVPSNQVKSSFYKGIAMIFLSLWFFLQIASRQFIISNLFLARDMDYLVQLLIPIPFVMAVAYLEEKKYYKEAMIFAWADIIDILLYFILLFSGAVNQNQIGFMIDFSMYVSVIYCAITLIDIIFRDKVLFEKIKVTVIAAAVLAISGILNSIFYYITGYTGTFLPPGIVFFTIVTEIQNSADVMKTVKKEIEFDSYKKSQKSLLASVSHEIRTPINAVLGLDKMIIKETGDDKVRDYALDIKTSGELLLSLVNDILEFSKMESGILRLVPKEYSLRELLLEVCTVIRTKAEAKDLKFIVTVNPKTPNSLCGDSQRIKQVLLNLLNNAVKYTRTGSVELTVDFDSEEETSLRLLFHVKDTGIGIREQDISKIFQPFVRVDEEKNKAVEGTGLGMNITENLLELMGSRVSVESKYGKGSDFSCRIVQEVKDKKPIGEFDAKAVIAFVPETDIAFRCPDAKILVVDDTPLNIKVFRGLMKEALAEIDSAGDGPEAIENAKNNRYDIIFMDQKMPGMGGFETMKEIKADPECGKNHETPIILLTANATPGMYEEAIRDGFNDYLSKPIAIPELIRILRKYLPKDKIEEISEEKKAAASADQEKDSSSDSNAELFEILRTECGLDAKTAAKNMGNEELYLSVLSDFAELGANNADEIEAFKNTKDIENYTIKVHALKSSARTIGAKLLSSEAKDLEELGDMARKGNSESFARIEMSTEKLLSDYRSLSESINDVLRINGIGNNTEGNTKTTLPEISESELKDAYSVILEMAEAFDIDGINAVVENLEGYRLSDADKEKVKAIKHSVKEVNYEGIKKAIR